MDPSQIPAGGVASPAPPRLSVVMPTHDALPYLDDSIRSIVGQTFADFELVILDDASTDGSAGALRAWAGRDARIRLTRSERRLGPTESANVVVGQARAAIVARMDADDVSHPDRLRRQLAIMERRPDVVLVGALSDGLDAAGRRVRPRDRWRLVRRSSFAPFPHGSAMFRRHVFEAVGGYRRACEGWQEQDVFLRMSDHGRVVVLADVLYHYRYREGSMTLAFSAEEAARAEGLRRRCFAERRMGRDYAPLLERAGADDVPAAAALAALCAAGAMRLWAGHRPRLVRRILVRDTFEWRPTTLRALAWAAWAEASPASLRLFLRSAIRGRDLLASLFLRGGEAREWRFE